MKLAMEQICRNNATAINSTKHGMCRIVSAIHGCMVIKRHFNSPHRTPITSSNAGSPGWLPATCAMMNRVPNPGHDHYPGGSQTIKLTSPSDCNRRAAVLENNWKAWRTGSEDAKIDTLYK